MFVVFRSLHLGRRRVTDSDSCLAYRNNDETWRQSSLRTFGKNVNRSERIPWSFPFFFLYVHKLSFSPLLFSLDVPSCDHTWFRLMENWRRFLLLQVVEGRWSWFEGDAEGSEVIAFRIKVHFPFPVFSHSCFSLIFFLFFCNGGFCYELWNFAEWCIEGWIGRKKVLVVLDDENEDFPLPSEWRLDCLNRGWDVATEPGRLLIKVSSGSFLLGNWLELK